MTIAHMADQCSSIARALTRIDALRDPRMSHATRESRCFPERAHRRSRLVDDRWRQMAR